MIDAIVGSPAFTLGLIITILILMALLVRANTYIVESSHASALTLLRRDYNNMRDSRDNNERAALQATIILENRVNVERKDKGLEPFPVMAAVMPEHNSPVTDEQSSTARFATIRARITAAALILGEEVPEIESPLYKEEPA